MGRRLRSHSPRCLQTITAGNVAAAMILIAGCRSGISDPIGVVGVPSPAAPGATAPHLSLAADGRVLMSGLEPASESHQSLRFAVLDGAAWSPAGTVVSGNDWFINWADFPSVTPITATDWTAHWLVKRPGGTYAYDMAIAISRDAGAIWSTALVPHDDGTRTEHGFATLFPWDDGFGAVWLDGRNTRQDTGGDREQQPDTGATGALHGMTVRYARIGLDGAIREAGEIDDLAGDCCATDVALAAAGPVATWRNRTPEEIRDIAVSRYAEGRWQPPVILGNDGWYLPGCPVNGSTIAARGERVVVPWFTVVNRSPRVQLAWSTDGARRFSVPVLVEEGAVNGRVDVVLVSDAIALVSWIGKTAEGLGQIRMRRVSVAGELGPVQIIAEGDVSRAAGFPQLVESRDGLVYAWTEPGEPSRVLTARSPL